MRNNRGFSLMEVLIVLVILGVLAGLAVPVYLTQVEKSRSAEALGMLAAARGSMQRAFAERGTYVDTVMGGGDGVATFNMDLNPNVEAVSGGQTTRFLYALVPAPADLTFTILATRIAAPGAPLPAGGPHTISINQAGAIVRTGIYGE